MRNNNSLGWLIFALIVLGFVEYLILNNIYVIQKIANIRKSDYCNDDYFLSPVSLDKDEKVPSLL